VAEAAAVEARVVVMEGVGTVAGYWAGTEDVAAVELADRAALAAEV